MKFTLTEKTKRIRDSLINLDKIEHNCYLKLMACFASSSEPIKKRAEKSGAVLKQEHDGK